MVDWAKHDKLEPQEHHVKKRSPFFPGMDGIFQPISGLFQRGGDDWRPNIPYVIFSRGQPGFDRTGAVQQVSRPSSKFYVGVRARPVANPQGLRPIDFDINESQLRGRSSGFKWLQLLESARFTTRPNYEFLETTRKFTPRQIPISSNSLFSKNPNGSYNRRLVVRKTFAFK